MDLQHPSASPPEILAPAGNKASFLAAIAAGADAVYCGLKFFSAHMAAKNFTIDFSSSRSSRIQPLYACLQGGIYPSLFHNAITQKFIRS